METVPLIRLLVKAVQGRSPLSRKMAYRGTENRRMVEKTMA